MIFEYLFTVRHYEQCVIAGENIIKEFRKGAKPTDRQILVFIARLKQTDLAAKSMPAWVYL
ncbi:MAG: hypothetical protein AABW75_03490 [Nanoarchaeota archaeon]